MSINNQNLLDTQVALLGSMLIDDRVVGPILTEVKDEDFTTPMYRMFYSAIRQQYNSGMPVDPVTVLDRVGKQYYDTISQFMQLTPTAANYKAYVELIKKQAMIYNLQQIASRMLTADDTEEMGKCMEEANAIMVSRPGIRCMNMQDALTDFYARHDPSVKIDYLSWGFRQIDESAFAGKGDMVVIGGYPSDGKTALALQFAMRQAKTKRVGFFSYETASDKLFDRIMADTCQISMGRLKRNTLNEQDWENASALHKRVLESKLDLIEFSGMTVSDIRAWAMAKHYDVIYIDYLQKIRGIGDPRRTDDFNRVTQVSNDLQQLGRQTGIEIIALSQLTRPEKQRVSYTDRETGEKKVKYVIPPPSMQSLRSSGQIEQDADIIMFLFREKPDDSNSRRCLSVAKNKDGVANIGIWLRFDGDTQTFRESALQQAAPTKELDFQETQQSIDDLPAQFLER